MTILVATGALQLVVLLTILAPVRCTMIIGSNHMGYKPHHNADEKANLISFSGYNNVLPVSNEDGENGMQGFFLPPTFLESQDDEGRDLSEVADRLYRIPTPLHFKCDDSASFVLRFDISVSCRFTEQKRTSSSLVLYQHNFLSFLLNTQDYITNEMIGFEMFGKDENNECTGKFLMMAADASSIIIASNKKMLSKVS
jgi:hypothetical protein